MAENGGAQILRGPGFSVTDREIIYAGGTLAIAETGAPLLEHASTRTTVLPTLLTIALLFSPSV
ncbi:MAG: hypothetical protein R3C27_14505 [Hyphomonadaceae bacterium]